MKILSPKNFMKHVNVKLTDRFACLPFLELYASNFPFGSICLEFWFEGLTYDPGGNVGILDIAEIMKINEITTISRKFKNVL